MATTPHSGEHARMAPDDQEGPRLSGAYLRATRKFLTDAGLDAVDVGAVMAILSPYSEEGEAEAEGEGNGAQDARHRVRMANDKALPASLRRWPTQPMSSREQASFEQRFPGVDKIRTL